jgi:hypothetical protein
VGASARGCFLCPFGLLLGARLGLRQRALERFPLCPVADRAVGDAERFGGRRLAAAGGQHAGSGTAPLLTPTASYLHGRSSQGWVASSPMASGGELVSWGRESSVAVD